MNIRNTTIEYSRQYRGFLPYLIIAVPYCFYLYTQLVTPVEPIVSDSFRYLWSADMTTEFFIGGSLSYRLLAWLLNNHPAAIVSVVLLCFLLTELSLFSAFKTSRYLYNCLFAVALLLLFDSSFVLGIHQKISPEGFFITMHILFIAALFRADGSYRDLLVFAIGVTFILSRNVAPYIALLSVFAYSPFAWKRDRLQTLWTLLLPLAIVSIVAADFTRSHDSSVQMNAANNMLARVFNQPELLDKFVSEYGMPPGPYIEACQNQFSPNATGACFHHKSLVTSDLSTYNYRLIDDPWGFGEWVENHGIDSWQHQILIEQPTSTISEFAIAFKQEFETPFFGSESNLLPVDVHASIRDLSGTTGISTLWGMLILFSAAGIIYLYFTAPLVIAGASILAAGSIANIFVSYFGDAMEIGRHTYPGYATLSIALGLLLVGFGFAIATVVRNNPSASSI